MAESNAAGTGNGGGGGTAATTAGLGCTAAPALRCININMYV